MITRTLEALLIAVTVLPGGWAASPQSPSAPTFRGGVDLVTVSVVVNDRNGRPVTGLSRDDFELFDAGRARTIADFRSERAPIGVAVLLDASGSMQVGDKWAMARDVVTRLASALEAGHDRLALFTFDTVLHEEQPFTTSTADVLRQLDRVRPWGSTALYDAAGQVGRQLANQSGRRAIVVVSDGADNRSRASAADVSAIISATDIPVYAVTVGSPLDKADEDRPAGGRESRAAGALDDLTRWTGGAMFHASTPVENGAAARQIVDELRHQYVMSFESGLPAGWHPLLVRVHDGKLMVRTRSGYMAGPRSGDRS